MRNITVKYGLYYAAALVICFTGSHFIFGTNPDNYSKSETLGYSIMLFTSIIVVLAVRAANQSADQPPSFFSGFRVGLGVSAIGGLAFAIYNWVYAVWLHPEFLGEYVAYHEAQIRQSGLGEVVMQEQLAELAAYSDMMSNTLLMACIMFIPVFVIGSLFGLCAAFAYRAKG